jgi:hypothetical protein
MDKLTLIIAWGSLVLFLGLCLFGIIGNYLLDHDRLDEKWAKRVRTWLWSFSDDVWRYPPAHAMRTANAAQSISPTERERLLKELRVEIADLVVVATSKAASKPLTPEERRRMSEALLREHEAGSEPSATRG